MREMEGERRVEQSCNPFGHTSTSFHFRMSIKTIKQSPNKRLRSRYVLVSFAFKSLT